MVAPAFDDRFRTEFRELLAWRRDVRRFKAVLPDSQVIRELLELACLAPSVGNSQPWRFVLVEDPPRRALVADCFRRCNDAALAGYSGELALVYARLKLAGLKDAPCHIAVFVDEMTSAGHGLGRQTMPETLHYSAVAAVHTLWLAARAYGLGVGWVSILSPEEVARVLDVPNAWALIAYLCVGYPEEEHLDPELERHGWQRRDELSTFVLRR
jgi:5,6-dimethylbenzimidazole synthase